MESMSPVVSRLCQHNVRPANSPITRFNVADPIGILVAVILDCRLNGTRILVYKWRGSKDAKGNGVLPDEINIPPGWDVTKAEVKEGSYSYSCTALMYLGTTL